MTASLQMRRAFIIILYGLLFVFASYQRFVHNHTYHVNLSREISKSQTGRKVRTDDFGLTQRVRRRNSRVECLF